MVVICIFMCYNWRIRGFNLINFEVSDEKVSEYFSYDFDLVLSGHAHGGQFRMPFIMNGFCAPNQGFFPVLAGGMYDFGKGKLL